MKTGMDIVERQIRIAAGLSVESDPPSVNGHSIQCRIYAEDPLTFIPSPGVLDEFHIPDLDGLRVDTGFRAGDEISSYFDPLLAKVIAWADTREAAIRLMETALSQTQITGLKTNIPTLQRALQHPDFRRGHYTTDLLSSLPQS